MNHTDDRPFTPCTVDCIAATCEMCGEQDCITLFATIDTLAVCSTCQYALAHDIAA